MNAGRSASHKYKWERLRSNYKDVEEQQNLLFKDDYERSSTKDASEYNSISDSEQPYAPKLRFPDGFWLTLLNLSILGATIIVNSKAIQSLWRDETRECVKATSSYSPFFDSAPIEFHKDRINGTLWPNKNPSWTRGEIHDPETEAMWDFFEDVRQFPISRADVLALGKDPETVARFPDEIFGLGDEAYIASLDIQHKLHCVNELRNMAFATYGPNSSKKKQHGQLWWHHLRHCLDIVAEDMICHADADIVTFRWVDTEPWPFPDFSVNRKCRSIDDLIQWRNERIVERKLLDLIKKPSGFTPIPHEPSYYAAYGFYYSELFPNGEGYTEELPSTEGWFGLPPSPDQGFEKSSKKDN